MCSSEKYVCIYVSIYPSGLLALLRPGLLTSGKLVWKLFAYNMCVCVCVYIYIYMCVCVCVCMRVRNFFFVFHSRRWPVGWSVGRLVWLVD